MANEPTPASEGITEKPAVEPAPAPVSEGITATPPAPPPPAVAPDPAPTLAMGPAPLPGWLLKADLAILAMLLVLTFLLGSFTATNSDVWMHLAIGQRLSEGTFEFGVDPFSWLTEATGDMAAPYWVHHSWLYSWLFFRLHEIVGGAGLVFIKALLCTIAVGLLSRIGWSENNRWFVLIMLATAALAISPRLVLQPLVISFLFLSIQMFVLDRVGFFGHARADGKTPCPRSLWALPPLFALWANLDAWFILGPIVLGLCWAGAGLTRWFPNAKVVPARTLGIVFGFGLLACLVNPHHVRVFQMPPELAYLVASVTDALHVRLPNEVVGAGRTLIELRKVDGEFAWTVSSLSSKYWYDQRAGFNIAGLAFYPLVLLGLLGFTLTALMKPQPGAPTFHVGRFALWLVFGVMALALYRMIPFFVLIAAPLTAMTLGEFLHWQQTVSGITIAKRNRGLTLARLVSIPFMLLLLVLAWPGWLQSSTDFTSLRRVAWDVRAEPSLQRTAETLQALKQKGEGENAFNGLSTDVTDYLAWFAPEVKFGMDSRFALYAERVPEYLNARKALAAQNSAEWEKYFVEHKVDQVIVVNVIKRDVQFPVQWLETDQWRQRGGDNRSVAFSWAGRGKSWPANEDAAWNREAFGPVPLERRPPAAGTPTPETPSAFTLYLDGIKPTPLGVPEFALLKKRYDVFGELRIKESRSVGMVWMYASLSGVQGLPDGGLTILPVFLTMSQPPWALSAINPWGGMAPPRDVGPPSLPILMVRATRKAVAENPLDAPSRSSLIEAVQTRHQMEDHWIGAVGFQASDLRERMRQLQVATNLYALTQIQPENFEAHLRLAKVYIQQEKMYDLALEHMQAAEKAMEALRPAKPDEQKFLEKMLTKQREDVKTLDKLVRQRQAKWKEISANFTPLQKALVAYRGHFEEVQGNQPVKQWFGLGKTARDLLADIKSESLPEDQQLHDAQLRFDLLLAMGNADIVMESLKKENARKNLPPALFARNQLNAGAALGDYDAMDAALSALEKLLQEEVKKGDELARERAGKFAPALLMAPKLGSASALATGTTFLALIPLAETDNAQKTVHLQHNELCNTITLRGIVALEGGNTEFARTLFKRALDEAGDTYNFPERAIARRYLDLLNEQKR